MKRLEKWTVTDSQMALDVEWCRIRRDTVRLPDGTVLDDYYLAVRPDVAVVFAVSAAHKVPLVRQYKHGAGEITLELPAGLIADETPEEAGRRELLEETGWTAPGVEHIGEFFDDSSKNTNLVFCLASRGAQPGDARQLDSVEAASGLEVVEFAVDELGRLIENGSIRAMSSVAAIYRALAWLREVDAL